MKIAIITTDNREHFKEYARPRPYFGTAPEALLQGFAQLAEVEVHVVSCARQRMQSPEKLANNIFFHSLVVPKAGWMTTAYQGCIRATRKKLREIQPDIVHGQGTELDCAMDAVFSGFANVLTLHGNMRLIAKVNRVRPFSFIWLAARLEARTIPRSGGVVCITHYTQEAVAEQARKTWVVPNAVDGTFFEVDAEPPLEKPPRFLCVGGICLRKNQNAFIRALDALARERPFELVFLGVTTPGRAYDDEFLQLVGERPWCSYPGAVNREQLKSYLRTASALALPSLEDNCPMVVLEAMAAGVPVVAAKVGGLPDLIEEGKTGFFCDPLDAGSMTRAMEKMLADRASARELAAHAKEQARARFHPGIVARRHIDVYRDVLSGTSSRTI
jgi:glycosyltransferase involved in cell wall biosynthesis